ncbi:YceI family protein [Pararobbsia silviterrae]|uniref:YceI family protein n=1 Tax=Pararobbsia silviterrae TaxID=1792498 RepID=A0A494X707_9BURK|nr:YceI family protein [Pararobbsia silviterrae]RKP46220.1 YceI family protein [Pararobbsia silviterrae]
MTQPRHPTPRVTQRARAYAKFGRACVVSAALASLAACTAVRVVTHTVDTTLAQAPAGTYQMDADHWSIVFDVEHLKYSRFVMRFDRAKATLQLDPNAPGNNSVKVAIDATSLDTNVKALDKIVMGDSLLDAARAPSITFESTRFIPTGPGTGKLTGNLTIRGKTAPVELDVVFNGSAPNPLTRAPTVGFAATGAFDRSAFGLTAWYPAVGNDIHVRIQAEFEQPAPGAARDASDATAN